MKLVFGIQDVPYSTHGGLSREQRRTLRWRLGRRPWQSLSSQTTTGEVAEILERRYGIYQFYWDRHKEKIVDQLANAMVGKLENVMMGKPPSSGPLFAPGDLTDIETGFREMIHNREMDGQVAGVPTVASLLGHNPRLAHPYAKANPVRPSFFASGLYSENFRAWIEE